MALQLSSRALNSELLHEVEELSGQNLFACYQCGKCSAGCPLAFAMDLLPHQVVRLLQLGREEMALSSNTIWCCVACLTCTTRCPKGVDLARVMEALRTIVLREGGEALELFRPPKTLVAEVPPQAAVSAFRKLSL